MTNDSLGSVVTDISMATSRADTERIASCLNRLAGLIRSAELVGLCSVRTNFAADVHCASDVTIELIMEQLK